MKYITTILTSIVGLSLAVFGFGTAFMEVHKATSDHWVAGAFFVLGIVGTLMTPYVGGQAAAAVKQGIQLGTFGRRAYDDGKAIPEIEIPPKAETKP